MFTQGSSSLLYWLCFKARSNRSNISPSPPSDSYPENAKTAVRCLGTGIDGALEAIFQHRHRTDQTPATDATVNVNMPPTGLMPWVILRLKQCERDHTTGCLECVVPPAVVC